MLETQTEAKATFWRNVPSTYVLQYSTEKVSLELGTNIKVIQYRKSVRS